MAQTTPAQSERCRAFAKEYPGDTFWCINRHIAQECGGKFLRGIKPERYVLAAVEDELGNFFCLTERRQRIQLTRDELFS